MKKLVILGGGYGGIKILLTLLDQGLPEDIQITVIDRNPYHSLKTEFYGIAAGTESDRNVRLEFPAHEQVDYVYSEVKKIDTDKDQVLVEEPHEPISYDYLVVALGCEDNYHGIEGAKEFTKSVQSISQAREAGFAVSELKAYGKVSVVGAGLSGIEVASEIRESRPDLNIRLLDRGETVLRAFDSKIQDYVEEWFAKNDVEVLHNANVGYVEKDGVCNNGICFINDVTIWTAGVRPNHLARELPVEKDTQEKVVVNEFYQVPKRPNVYIVGDCASSEHSPSAQLAGQQGEQIADILSSVLRGETPQKPKPLKLKGALGSLGKSDGFGNMLQKPVTGLLPRLAKSGVLWLNKRH
ncbi:NAD(P)/FAD-dependent oxidoreductase [Halobacillus salinarum]|uniref:NAD(P)/FAD-dependent oxidoreductase n=1 Tax=Halobacillus salinarum TaxID=2932257 RepID=A0ABY4EHJ8_9BACI|nr:NAD(P)/FAD-dependent oxidoreductase [Halobacillus salinarum]UOQ43941.1 NAD(P)/FAD-dependent oxidoreductase [Halobacillus salinarum]